jgi:hypothetical protein
MEMIKKASRIMFLFTEISPLHADLKGLWFHRFKRRQKIPAAASQ